MTIERFQHTQEIENQTPMRALWVDDRGVTSENAQSMIKGSNADLTVVTSIEEFSSEWQNGDYNVLIFDHQIGYGVHGSTLWKDIVEQGEKRPLIAAVITSKILEKEKQAYTWLAGTPNLFFSKENANYEGIGAELRKTFEDVAAAEGISAPQLAYLAELTANT